VFASLLDDVTALFLVSDTDRSASLLTVFQRCHGKSSTNVDMNKKGRFQPEQLCARWLDLGCLGGAQNRSDVFGGSEFDADEMWT
jgi:hypothetical protein